MVEDLTAYDRPGSLTADMPLEIQQCNALLPRDEWDAAWATRAVIDHDHRTATRRMVMLADPQSSAGRQQARETLVAILNNGVTLPRSRAAANRALVDGGPLRTDREGTIVLFSDHTVTVLADTFASTAWLYVCAYTRPAVDGTSLGSPQTVLAREVQPGCYVYRETPDGRHGGWYRVIDAQRRARQAGAYNFRFDRPEALRNSLRQHYALGYRMRETIRYPHETPPDQSSP